MSRSLPTGENAVFFLVHRTYFVVPPSPFELPYEWTTRKSEGTSQVNYRHVASWIVAFRRYSGQTASIEFPSVYCVVQHNGDTRTINGSSPRFIQCATHLSIVNCSLFSRNNFCFSFPSPPTYSQEPQTIFLEHFENGTTHTRIRAIIFEQLCSMPTKVTNLQEYSLVFVSYWILQILASD